MSPKLPECSLICVIKQLITLINLTTRHSSQYVVTMTRQTTIKEAATQPRKSFKLHTQVPNFSRLKLVDDSFNFPYQDHPDELSKCSFKVAHHLSQGKFPKLSFKEINFLACNRLSIGREVLPTNRKENDS